MTYSIEEWKPVSGWEGFYEISSYGRVRTLGGMFPHRRNLVMRQRLDGNGYPLVRLYRAGKYKESYVHYIVAVAFIGERPEGLVINHKDGVKTRNLPSNLEYVTVAENNRHAFRILKRKPSIPYSRAS